MIDTVESMPFISAYSDEEEICNLCCRLLNKIVKRQRDLDVSFLVRYDRSFAETLQRYSRLVYLIYVDSGYNRMKHPFMIVITPFFVVYL